MSKALEQRAYWNERGKRANEGKPYYDHDCDRCRFVKHISIFGHNADIYRSCERINSPSYIARFSDEGSDYQTIHKESGLEYAICIMLDHNMTAVNYAVD